MTEPNAAFHVVPIQHTDVFAAVLDQLEKLIDNGGYEPGDRLPSERDLAQALAVSRVGVREALKVLESSGKVTRRQGAGTFELYPHSDPLAASFLGQLIDARATIEVGLAELGAEHGTEDEFSEIRKILERNETENSSDDEPGSLSVVFEIGVARAAHNEVLSALQRTVHQVWVEAWSQLGLTPGHKEEFHEEHLEIYEALVRRDPVLAGDAMRRHVDRSPVEVSDKSARRGRKGANGNR